MTETRIRTATADEIDSNRDNDVSLSTALRRRIGLVIGVTVLLAVVAGALTYMRPTSYTATAKLQLRPLPGNPLNDAAVYNSQEVTVAMSSEAATVDTAPVLAKLGIPAGSSSVKVSVVLNTTTMTIGYTAGNATDAEQKAKQLAQNFLNYRRSIADVVTKTGVGRLQPQLDDAVNQLSALPRTTDTTPPAEIAKKAYLSNQVLELQKSIAKLQTLIKDSSSLESETPAVPSGTKLKLLLPIAAALLGFLLSAAYAVYRGKNERAIRGSDHVAIAGRPVLANLTGRQRGRGVTENDNAALRRARLGLLATTGPHSVVALSPVGAGGAVNGEIARRLGRSLSNAGYRVALVDCRQADARSERRARARRKTRAASVAQPTGPTLDELFDTGWTPDTELGRVGPLAVVHGACRPLGADQVRLGDLLHAMARDYDFVIVEADPLDNPSGLAAVFASDQLVLTAIERTTLRVDIERIIERATRIGTNIIGVVVSAPSRRLRAEDSAAQDRGRDTATERTDDVGETAGWVPDPQ